MCDVAVREGVCRLAVPGGRWLGSGVNGGFRAADGAVNVSVPTDFDRRDLEAVVAERCAAAGFDVDGPALLTAVAQEHARAATAGPATVVATAGLSNPATLDVKPSEETPRNGTDGAAPPPGTVNLLVATDRALGEAQLASCLATAVEAKTATLQALTGFSGTTSDAVAVGADPAGDKITFVGSSTPVGRAVRACVRDAVRASLVATYAEDEIPTSVGAAEHGVATDRATRVFEL